MSRRKVEVRIITTPSTDNTPTPAKTLTSLQTLNNFKSVVNTYATYNKDKNAVYRRYKNEMSLAKVTP